MRVKECQLRILVVDDEPAAVEWLKALFEGARYEVRSSFDGTTARAITTAWRPDIVVADLLLPDVAGTELVESLKRIDSDLPIIVLTGDANIARSVETVKAGAFDFLEKPVDPDLLLDKVDKALRQQLLHEENARLRHQLDGVRSLHGVIGHSEGMRRLYDLIECVAPSEANVLIQGESGTGKELIANAIHENSPRSKGPFIKVNCAAIPADLIESELFGYRRGAFTGATNDRDGLFKLAEGGSLLLDEIAEMPPYLQTKLLRVLQEREYRPIASDRVLRADFRLICATNIDADRAVKESRLREDLYFRINTVTLRVPPLRERTEDLPMLCEHFVDQFCRQYGKSPSRMSADAYRVMVRHRWPGNVRELEHVIERAVIVAKQSEIAITDLAGPLRDESKPEFFIPPNRTLAQIEKMAIVQALERASWNKVEAARMLGLFRATLYSKMKKYRIAALASGAEAMA